MLVLTRKAGQDLQVGRSIRIQVLRIIGNRVKIAIEAPKNLRILRGELGLDFTENAVSQRRAQPIERNNHE